MGTVIDVVAGLIAIGAGVYLLGTDAVPINLGSGTTGTSWFEVLGHGIGAYFIAKGLFMMRSAYRGAIQAMYLKTIAEHAEAVPPDPPRREERDGQ